MSHRMLACDCRKQLGGVKSGHIGPRGWQHLASAPHELVIWFVPQGRAAVDPNAFRNHWQTYILSVVAACASQVIDVITMVAVGSSAPCQVFLSLVLRLGPWTLAGPETNHDPGAPPASRLQKHRRDVHWIRFASWRATRKLTGIALPPANLWHTIPYHTTPNQAMRHSAPYLGHPWALVTRP